MRRPLVTFLIAAAVMTAIPAAASAPRSSPSLALAQRTPLKVRGSHFQPRERVWLRATAGARRASVKVRTTRYGRLVANFDDFAAPLCVRLVVKAVGARGDRARLIVEPPPDKELPCPL